VYLASGEQTVILIIVWRSERVRKRLSVSKETTHRFHMVTFNLKKLNEVEEQRILC
jgi:hypothetical protein